MLSYALWRFQTQSRTLSYAFFLHRNPVSRHCSPDAYAIILPCKSELSRRVCSQCNLFKKLDYFTVIQPDSEESLQKRERGLKKIRFCVLALSGESTFGPGFRASSVTSRGEQWATRTAQLDILTLWPPSRRFLDRLRAFFFLYFFYHTPARFPPLPWRRRPLSKILEAERHRGGGMGVHPCLFLSKQDNQEYALWRVPARDALQGDGVGLRNESGCPPIVMDNFGWGNNLCMELCVFNAFMFE